MRRASVHASSLLPLAIISVEWLRRVVNDTFYSFFGDLGAQSLSHSLFTEPNRFKDDLFLLLSILPSLPHSPIHTSFVRVRRYRKVLLYLPFPNHLASIKGGGASKRARASEGEREREGD